MRNLNYRTVRYRGPRRDEAAAAICAWASGARCSGYPGVGDPVTMQDVVLVFVTVSGRREGPADAGDLRAQALCGRGSAACTNAIQLTTTARAVRSARRLLAAGRLPQAACDGPGTWISATRPTASARHFLTDSREVHCPLSSVLARPASACDSGGTPACCNARFLPSASTPPPARRRWCITDRRQPARAPRAAGMAPPPMPAIALAWRPSDLGPRDAAWRAGAPLAQALRGTGPARTGRPRVRQDPRGKAECRDDRHLRLRGSACRASCTA